MAVKVLIPAPLRRYTSNQESLELEGGSVGEILDDLTGRYGELKKHLYGEDGKLRNFVNIYVNDEDIRHLQQQGTVVQPTDVISIVPSIAGGF
ncbi:MoaD/ThiS family protein [Gloeobacter morelensis]|uniref:MoaD/ThiS family protein n=1 Tax=Gloeobacter morelensis MG652769 TaxID=2781736 RepID=A0ABY3PGY3_9CYAN|nr:MoaD/ThiS family protein [Gloeobacter morelensis]UFP92926.1 MoaD/ThiS family protein [Gloeobacter morelensis MG652769]